MRSSTAEILNAECSGSRPLLVPPPTTPRPFKPLIISGLIAFFLFGKLAAQPLFPEKPNPAVFVHDYSGWLTPDEQIRLETRLQQYEDSTSTEIVVMIRPDIGDYDKASYAVELLNRWGVGKKGKNNGLVMLIKTEPPQRGVFITTGYGAEGGLNDGKIGTIIRTRMIPFFNKNGILTESRPASTPARPRCAASSRQHPPRRPMGGSFCWSCSSCSA